MIICIRYIKVKELSQGNYYHRERKIIVDIKKIDYDTPKITTYTEEDILNIVGPAQTVTSGGPPPEEYP